jgi:hypothetical protein
MSRLAKSGWGWSDPERFRLTPRGLRFADAAAELFLVEAPRLARSETEAPAVLA